MLSPSDFNNAVPQFTNGSYASNPINPQYVNEPNSTEYNQGVEPLQTLPAQWWNWFLNKFTTRFNKVNIYVKNLFNELAQLLDLLGDTPDGTEAIPTTGQLRCFFDSQYPAHVVSCTTGTACGCVPLIGTALGNTNNNILVTDTSGYLKPSGITVGTAAGCDASCFLQSGDSVGYATCADCGNCNGTYKAFGTNAFNSTAFTTCTGTVTVSNLAACDAATPVALCTGSKAIGKSTSCALTFNTCTGVLTAKTFCGTATKATTSTKLNTTCGSGTSAYGLCLYLTCQRVSSFACPRVELVGRICENGGSWATCSITVDHSDTANMAFSSCYSPVQFCSDAVQISRMCPSCSSCCCRICIKNLCNFPVVASVPLAYITASTKCCCQDILIDNGLQGMYIPANTTCCLNCCVGGQFPAWCVCGIVVSTLG